MRRSWLITGGVAALAVVALACGAGSKSSTGTTAGSGSGSGTSTAPAAAGLNTAVRDGKFEFTVTGVKCGVAKVGKDPMSKKAQGEYCQVSVKVKNIGNEAQMFSGDSQKAFNAAGQTYTDDSAAELYANPETWTANINPGNQVSGVVIFDVPKGTKLTKVELHDSAFSGGVTVNLA